MASFAGPGRAGSGLLSWPLLLLLLTGLKGPVSAISEAGKWTLDVDSVSVPGADWGPAREHADWCLFKRLCGNVGINQVRRVYVTKK